MPSPLPQSSFSRGEIAPSAQGRVDLAAYQVGAATVRNFIVRVLGGLVNRPGTEFVCELRDSSKSGRLINFQYSTTQGYCLQFEDGWLRVVKDGGQVLRVGTIAGTTNATPVVVNIVAHGYVDGTVVTIDGTGIAALDGHTFVVDNATADEFELFGSTAPGSSASTGTASAIFEVVSPYTTAQLDALKFASLNDVMTLTHGSVRPKNLSRTAHDAWTFADTEFKLGPFQDINADKINGVAVSAVTGTITITTSVDLFTSAHVGMLFYMEQKNAGKPWEPAKTVVKDDIRRSEGRYYRALDGGTTGTLRPSNEVVGDTEQDGTVTWEYVHSGYGIALITAVNAVAGLPNTATATVINEIPVDIIGATAKTITGAANNGSGLIRITATSHGYATNDVILIQGVGGTTEANGLWEIEVIGANTFDLRHSTFVTTYTSGGKAIEGGTYKYAFGAWAGDQGWPEVVTYFQQRRTFAKNTNIWQSGTNAYDNFGHSTPTKDDDAITMRLASDQANAIRHMLGLGKLVVFTAGGKWVLPDDDSSPILTPANHSARPQGSLGASDVRPALIEDSILYTLDMGGAVYDLSYQFASNSFSGSELSVLASHLLEGHEIVDAAYQHTPFRCWWIVRDDGAVVGLSYLKEHQVVGWHRHDTDGFFERVCVVREPPEDRVYFQVKRTINGPTKRYIERLASRLYTDIKDAIFMDCALTYDGRNTGATTMLIDSGGGDWTYNGASVFTLTANPAYFAAGDVNDEIHFTADDGSILRAKITAYTSPTLVSVTVNRDVATELRSVALTAWGHAQAGFTGMDHLEAKEIAILADGHVHDRRTVASGAFSLDYCATVVHAGLPIEADMETLDINMLGQESVRTKEKIVSKVDVLVEESRGFWAGPDFDHLTEYKQRQDENYDEPVDLFTGQAEIRINTTWTKGGRVAIRQPDPLPLSVLSVIPNVEAGGSA